MISSRYLIYLAVLIAAVLGAIWLVSSSPPSPASKIISRSGLHWHAELTVFVKGEKQEIPANVGLGLKHEPIHTHDSDGIVHLEFSGLVSEEKTRLGEFFRIWGKTFDSNCVFDFCGGPGAVKMFVNSRPNQDFENYLMKDGDRIEIRYE